MGASLARMCMFARGAHMRVYKFVSKCVGLGPTSWANYVCGRVWECSCKRLRVASSHPPSPLNYNNTTIPHSAGAKFREFKFNWGSRGQHFRILRGLFWISSRAQWNSSERRVWLCLFSGDDAFHGGKVCSSVIYPCVA